MPAKFQASRFNNKRKSTSGVPIPLSNSNLQNGSSEEIVSFVSYSGIRSLTLNEEIDKKYTNKYL